MFICSKIENGFVKLVWENSNMSAKMCKELFLLTFLMFSANLATVSSTKSTVNCAADRGECNVAVKNCTEKCGCDKFYYYNATLDACMFNYEYFNNNTVEKYNFLEKIEIEAEKAFNGIMISVILLASCCLAMAATACIYCCRIDYTDNKLRQEVEALAKKCKRDGKLLKSIKKEGTNPIAENCTVMCGEGAFVV